jgi:hypothetical protein
MFAYCPQASLTLRAFLEICGMRGWMIVTLSALRIKQMFCYLAAHSEN